MRFRVLAEEPVVFDAWTKTEVQPAMTPSTAEAIAGEAQFKELTCTNCHNIGGVNAQKQYAPDLTHVGSRKMLAAERLENTPENLRDWLHQPNIIKPNCLMPNLKLGADDLTALTAYLELIVPGLGNRPCGPLSNNTDIGTGLAVWEFRQCSKRSCASFSPLSVILRACAHRRPPRLCVAYRLYQLSTDDITHSCRRLDAQSRFPRYPPPQDEMDFIDWGLHNSGRFSPALLTIHSRSPRPGCFEP
jgi:cytochrome c2